MSNPFQSEVLDRMIARLEEANTRSYKDISREDQSPTQPSHGDLHHLSNHQGASQGRSRWIRTRRWLFVVAGLSLAVTLYSTDAVWRQAYGDTMRSIVSRWANVWIFQTASETTRRDETTPTAPKVSLGVEPRFQQMSDELADLRQRLEQLKKIQDEELRSVAEIAMQLKTGQEQMLRDNTNLFDQLRATQQQLAGAVSSRTANSDRKPPRRKHKSTIRRRV